MNDNATDMSSEDTRQMLADSARTYVTRAYGDSARAASLAHPHACDPQRWQEFADMGWLALPLPETDGGLGGGMADICVVAEELGMGLVVEPFVACAVMGGMLLHDVAPGSVREAWLPGITQGRLRVAFAPWEPGAGFDHEATSTQATRDGGNFRLQGDKSLVPGGTGADAFLLAARIGDSSDLGIFLVPAAAPGLSVTPQVLYDGQHAVRLQLHQAQAGDALMAGPAGDILPRLELALQRGIIAHCAETVGTMQRVFDITLDYLKTRKQFGRVIAANQVVQHRLVDLYVEVEEARALTHSAAAVLDNILSGDAAQRRRVCAAARACVVQTAQHVWEESVQLHGAIGMTQEYVLGQFVKRLALACTLYGGLEMHLERLAAVSLARTP